MTEHTRHNDLELSEHIVREEKVISEINSRLSSVEITVNELKEIMVQAKGAVQLIKILAGLSTAIAATYLFLTNNFTILPK